MSSTNISAKEAAILLAVINSTLNVDWVNVAAVSGLKNGTTAFTCFSQIKRKLCLTGTPSTGTGGSGHRASKPRTPAKPHASSGGRKDTPTKGTTPTRARKIKAPVTSYKLDTIEEEVEEDEEAVTDYEDGHKKAKDKADATEARAFMATSDDENAEDDRSVIERVARGDFADDDDDYEMDSDAILVHEEFPKTVAAVTTPKTHGKSLFAGFIIAEYDDCKKNATYVDDETAAPKRILYIE